MDSFNRDKTRVAPRRYRRLRPRPNRDPARSPLRWRCDPKTTAIAHPLLGCRCRPATVPPAQRLLDRLPQATGTSTSCPRVVGGSRHRAAAAHRAGRRVRLHRARDGRALAVTPTSQTVDRPRRLAAGAAGGVRQGARQHPGLARAGCTHRALQRPHRPDRPPAGKLDPVIGRDSRSAAWSGC